MNDTAMTEWRYWRIMCAELQARGIDVNAPEHEVLCRTIRAWGNAYLDLFAGTGDRSPHATLDAATAIERARHHGI